MIRTPVGGGRGICFKAWGGMIGTPVGGGVMDEVEDDGERIDGK